MTLKFCITLVFTFYSLILFSNETPKPFVNMVAVGDSITVGFNSDSMGVNFDKSWSTGTDRSVNSHYLRLSEMYEVKAINKAVAGSTITQALNQVVEAIEESTIPIDYLTMIVGANDLCGWPLEDENYLAEYTKHLQNAIAVAIVHNPEIKILISSLPDIRRLYEIGKEKRFCRTVWNTGRVCPKILSPRAKNREIYFDRWQAMNDEISNIARDNHTNIIFTEEISNYQFTDEDISRWDCFHPSAKGQNKISETLWMLGWFY